MIIDTHVHVWALDADHQPPPNAVLKPPTSALPVEWLVEDMGTYHVDRCVLVLASTFGWDNSYMTECLDRYPSLFKAIGLVNPLSPTNAEDLRYWMRQGLSGFRFHPLYYPDDQCWIDSPSHDALWDAAVETNAILQFHMWPRHAIPLARMIERHPNVRVIVDHIGKPDVTEASPFPSFQPVIDLARFPNVWVKIGDYQIASKQSFPWRDTFPFLAALKDAFGPDRIIWGTGYAGTARLVPLAQALQYVREEIPCFTASDVEKILGETPSQLFGF